MVMAEEILRKVTIDSILWLLVVMFMQIYIKKWSNEEKQNVHFWEEKEH